MREERVSELEDLSMKIFNLSNRGKNFGGERIEPQGTVGKYEKV